MTYRLRCDALSQSGFQAGRMQSGNRLHRCRSVATPRRRPRTHVAHAGCPFCADTGKCKSICRNPQNRGTPENAPVADQTAVQAVCSQLDALKQVDVPWKYHGIAVMYEYCCDADAMTRSRYFGMSEDLYIQDHFMGSYTSKFPDMIGLVDYEIQSCKDTSDGRCCVVATIHSKVGDTSDIAFVMLKQDQGQYRDCWMTHRLLRVESDYYQKLAAACGLLVPA